MRPRFMADLAPTQGNAGLATKDLKRSTKAVLRLAWAWVEGVMASKWQSEGRRPLSGGAARARDVP